MCKFTKQKDEIVVVYLNEIGIASQINEKWDTRRLHKHCQAKCRKTKNVKNVVQEKVEKELVKQKNE